MSTAVEKGMGRPVEDSDSPPPNEVRAETENTLKLLSGEGDGAALAQSVRCRVRWKVLSMAMTETEARTEAFRGGAESKDGDGDLASSPYAVAVATFRDPAAPAAWMDRYLTMTKGSACDGQPAASVSGTSGPEDEWNERRIDTVEEPGSQGSEGHLRTISQDGVRVVVVLNGVEPGAKEEAVAHARETADLLAQKLDDPVPG
ncbi:hypothetical protein [Micrococcus luteus]|uniref:hypothetical protein n=1 Tax=Micrococcus luteus TaxID=1270 RepID=UPI0011A7D741|nr:hypothetical protein [Micrococcus luteus]